MATTRRAIPISRSQALLPREHRPAGRVKARIEEIQAELLEELRSVDVETTRLVDRREQIVAELRRCRDALGGVGSHRVRKVPLPLDVDAQPEGTRAVVGSDLRDAVVAMIRAADHPLSISEIHRLLLAHGLHPETRASKAISDALRPEVATGRIVRLERGLYFYPR